MCGSVTALDPNAFASRFVLPADLPFIASSFAGSYIQAGHIGGMRDVFTRYFARPFAQLVKASSQEPEALVSTRVVYPVSEPTEVAGYAVSSPRYACLVYLLVKPAYARRRVAAHLLTELPTLAGDPRDRRRYFLHCFSTVEFAKMCQHLEIKTRYSPMLFQRMLDELTEEPTL